MAFDAVVVKCIQNELEKLLTGGRVDKIYMPDNDSIVIAIRSLGKNYKLFLSCKPSLPRIHLSNHIRENPKVPPNFCMLLRKHLSGGRLVFVKQPGMERIIELGIENRNELGDLETKRLIIEIMGRYSNIILVSQEGRIADCVRRVDATVSSVRMVLPGFNYESPPPQDKISLLDATYEEIEKTLFLCQNETKIDKYILDNFLGLSPMLAREIVFRVCGQVDITYMEISRTQVVKMAEFIFNMAEDIKNNKFTPVIIRDDQNIVKDFSAIEVLQYGNKENIENLSEYLDEFYIAKEVKGRITQKSSDITKTVNNLLDRYRKKAILQQQSVNEADKMDKYKLYGDLITANIYQIQKGDKRLITANFYDETMAEIEISLDANLTPSENAQKYYTRYNKLKNTAVAAEIQLKNSLLDIKYLESVQSAIEICDNVEEIAEIRAELADERYIKMQKTKKVSKPSVLSKFISTDGFTIMVGKNNRQNDYLTLKIAKNHDIWFHTKNIPGSHTVIITNKEKVSEATMHEAAMLAAYYSKAGKSQNIAVDYTEVKNVKKPSGAKPGMVIYVDYKTAYVTPDEEKISTMRETDRKE